MGRFTSGAPSAARRLMNVTITICADCHANPGQPHEDGSPAPSDCVGDYCGAEYAGLMVRRKARSAGLRECEFPEADLGGRLATLADDLLRGRLA